MRCATILALVNMLLIADLLIQKGLELKRAVLLRTQEKTVQIYSNQVVVLTDCLAEYKGRWDNIETNAYTIDVQLPGTNAPVRLWVLATQKQIVNHIKIR